ncbi:uncharacterized protein LOC123658255 [Melitaea cinxia]|uniref:uncharacterized protein LOC123658255 n=1 Tax=Melitaea cinxia TaxID=113334 RepID=UPI001E27354C|nr:uncharacterized protein LOC123658255 [Melitaea cinxia]
MTNLLKCNKCNIVIDELLSYLQNKISVADEETLVRICTSSFTADDIKNSKSLLFDSIPGDRRKIFRKSKGKEERDIVDIISLLKSVDPDVVLVFVARQLEKLPPILFDHLDCTKILKDILVLKNEVEDIKNSYAKKEDMQDIKNELLRHRYDTLPPASAFKVNTKRGAWMDSGPMGLSHDGHCTFIEDSYTKNSNKSLKDMQLSDEIRRVNEEISSNRQRSDECSDRCAGGELPAQAMSQEATGRASSPSETINAVTSPGRSSTVPRSPIGKQLINTDTTNSVNDERQLSARETTTTISQNKDNEAWKTVVNRKRQIKYRFLGKTGVARDLTCSFRAAERKIPMFITNVHISASEDDIVKHIFNNTQETVVLEKIMMKSNRGHKAYKFLISEHNLSKYMDEKLWPVGVIFRRFVHFKNRKTISAYNDTVYGSSKTHNG